MRTTTRLLPSRRGNLGVLSLNNPKSLHALTLDMVQSMTDVLDDWMTISPEDSNTTALQAILIKSTDCKRPAFCAGGDVKQIYESSNVGFFLEEYQLNHKIASSKIPIISLWDGVVMGGGVGISIHGQYRIATENTLFAMPETALGLFPDVGSMYWMPRILSKPMANYLALTGERIKACDLVHFGLATHYLPSRDLPNLEQALLEATNSSGSLASPITIADVLDSFHRPVENYDDSILFQHQQHIELAFDAETVEGIVKNLHQGNSEFHQKTLATLDKMSPASLKVTLEGLGRGARCKTLAEDLQMEYRMAKAFVGDTSSDFYEGVRSILVDKDRNPKWDPPTLEEVTDQQVQAFFGPVDDELIFTDTEEPSSNVASASKL